MAAALKHLFDKRNMALARARLKAWWDGEDFDEEAALAAFEAAAAGHANDADPGEELFDETSDPIPPRLLALTKLWGEGRLRPGDDTADALEPARLGVAPEGVIAVSGAGLAGPLLALARAHPGKIDAFEWREETVDQERAGIRKAKLEDRITVTRIDLEAHVWPADSYDGVWSIDDFAYASYPPHLAHQFSKMLKTGACAVVESYVGLPIPEFASAFASSFAEPQIRAHGDMLQFFADAGLLLEQDEDLTEEFLDLARQGFKRLEQVLADAAALDVTTARELAWEAEAWRLRLRLLAQRRLERRRFVLRKVPADQLPPPAQDEEAAKTNAPEF